MIPQQTTPENLMQYQSENGNFLSRQDQHRSGNHHYKYSKLLGDTKSPSLEVKHQSAIPGLRKSIQSPLGLEDLGLLKGVGKRRIESMGELGRINSDNFDFQRASRDLKNHQN